MRLTRGKPTFESLCSACGMHRLRWQLCEEASSVILDITRLGDDLVRRSLFAHCLQAWKLARAGRPVADHLPPVKAIGRAEAFWPRFVTLALLHSVDALAHLGRGAVDKAFVSMLMVHEFLGRARGVRIASKIAPDMRRKLTSILERYRSKSTAKRAIGGSVNTELAAALLDFLEKAVDRDRVKGEITTEVAKAVRRRLDANAWDRRSAGEIADEVGCSASTVRKVKNQVAAKLRR